MISRTPPIPCLLYFPSNSRLSLILKSFALPEAPEQDSREPQGERNDADCQARDGPSGCLFDDGKKTDRKEDRRTEYDENPSKGSEQSASPETGKPQHLHNRKKPRRQSQIKARLPQVIRFHLFVFPALSIFVIHSTCYHMSKVVMFKYESSKNVLEIFNCTFELFLLRSLEESVLQR